MKKNKPVIFYTDSKGRRQVEIVPSESPKSDKPKTIYTFILEGEGDYNKIQKSLNKYLKNEKK